MRFSVRTVKASVQRPEIRYSKRCASLIYPFEAMIRTICLQMLPYEILRNEILTLVNPLSEMQALKLHPKLHFQILTIPRIKLICRL